jgi:hypothetical protein
MLLNKETGLDIPFAAWTGRRDLATVRAPLYTRATPLDHKRLPQAGEDARSYDWEKIVEPIPNPLEVMKLAGQVLHVLMEGAHPNELFYPTEPLAVLETLKGIMYFTKTSVTHESVWTLQKQILNLDYLPQLQATTVALLLS